MDSRATKRFLKIGSRDICISIEPHFWICLEEIARSRATTAAGLAATIATTQTDGNVTAAIRSYVLDYFRSKARETTGADPVPRRPPALASDIDISRLRPRWLN